MDTQKIRAHPQLVSFTSGLSCPINSDEAEYPVLLGGVTQPYCTWGQAAGVPIEDLSRSALKLAKQKQYGQALFILNYLIAQRPDSAQHYSNRGLIELWRGNPTAALKDCDRAVQLDARSDQAYNNRANCYAALQDWPHALADYDRAIDLNPLNIRARINQGITLRDMGRYEAALEVFDTALWFGQLEAHVYAERGRTYHLRGDWNCAIADYNRAIAAASSAHPLLEQRVNGWREALLSMAHPLE